MFWQPLFYVNLYLTVYNHFSLVSNLSSLSLGTISHSYIMQEIMHDKFQFPFLLSTEKFGAMFMQCHSAFTAHISHFHPALRKRFWPPSMRPINWFWSWLQVEFFGISHWWVCRQSARSHSFYDISWSTSTQRYVKTPVASCSGDLLLLTVCKVAAMHSAYWHGWWSRFLIRMLMRCFAMFWSIMSVHPHEAVVLGNQMLH